MQRVIKQQSGDTGQQDQWQLLTEVPTDFVPEKGAEYILPLSDWQSLAPVFSGFGQIPGVWFDADIELEPLEQVFASAPIIAVSFPAFTDGSGFSTGSLIREVFGYKGELRAFGSLLSDQLGYLRRCGYDSVALPEDQDMETGRQQFHAEMVSYQGDILQPFTPFRRRVRPPEG
ncbi:DUF934 domain-containing protein [Aliamphritea spongicola]|uniref:DUF934 domain-containing protein n=1 Tax=Aliamphritea spongicola TaxID=707589 RepID=UPI00196AE5BB|nr:DUF934 domain-containing protein [Aliamphritea spongicola]MBN3562240.1 DUF934 domain-containing protein [Aliamphritea spongicola]